MTKLKERAIPFPKYLIVEHATSYFSNHQDCFIRIHEKAKLDHKSDELSFLYLTGVHQDSSGKVVTETNALDMIFEEVHSVSYCMGNTVSNDLSKFTEILVQSYKNKYPKI